MITQKEFEEGLNFLFKDNNEPREFLFLYAQYCELIDDLVDEEKNIDRIRQAFLVAGKVFNCNYWLKWRHCLFLVDRLAHNTYFDSVTWETSDEEWRRQHAKVYSHAAINMTLSVILIEFGDDKLKELSPRLRELCYDLHKGDKI